MILDGGDAERPGPSGHRLVATYFEQKEALARLFRARLGPSGEIEDLMQDLYLKVAGLDSAMEVRDCRAFLYRLASNLLMDRWRSGRSSAARDGAWRLTNHATGNSEDIADIPSAEAVVAGRERLGALLAALAELPPKTQTVFRLHKFDGLTYAEVAARLAISRSAVEKHMMDALRVLSARIQR